MPSILNVHVRDEGIEMSLFKTPRSFWDEITRYRHTSFTAEKQILIIWLLTEYQLLCQIIFETIECI